MTFGKLHISSLEYTMPCIFSLLLVVGWGHQASGFYGNYPIQNFTPGEYKAGIQNIDFAQNGDMTLFVANNLGVLSYNGNEWERHNFRTGKKKRSLAFDEHTNRLYVGSQGEFGYFEGDWQYVSLLDLIPQSANDFDEVWDVFLLEGKAYFCTFQGIYIYDGQSISVVDQEGGLERSFMANGRLFTQSQQGRLYELEGQRLIPSYQQGLSNKVISGLVPHGDGYLLFYNSGEIELITPMGSSPQYKKLMEALEGTYVNHVLQLSDTRLAISTQTAGLFLFDLQNNSIEHITMLDGLATNACLRAFQDYYGNIWVGMQNGIALIHLNSPMRLIGQEINLQGSGYEAYEAKEGTYFTTSNGIYFLEKNAAKSKFLRGAEGPSYGIQEIAGRLYAGHHTGLFLLENGKATRVADIDGVWQVKQLRSNPAYAIGGTYFGLYLFRIASDQSLRPVQAIEGFNLSSRFFEEDQEGHIWVGQYYKGLYRLSLSDDYTQASVENISTGSDRYIQDQILLSRVEEELYLGSSMGIYQLDPTEGEIIEAELFSGLIGQQAVYLFEQDRKNNVHVLTENGVGYFRKVGSGNFQYVPSSLYQLQYYLNNDLLHISTSTSEGVFFAANEGFIQYVPEVEDPLRVKQPLVIRQVYSVTKKRALYTKKPFEKRPEKISDIVVSPADKVLKIDIESFQFSELNDAKYRYYLKGFDEGFGAWTNTASKEYTNLREGDYEFIVQTRNHLGEIISSQPLPLHVNPPLYRSTPARVFYVLGGIALLFMVSRLQRRKYKQRADKIEETRRMELAIKQQKLAEVEQQKEKELLQLKEEKIESELQHVNKLLAASTMNLVVKNEFIESIKKELQEVSKSGKKATTRQALEKIVKEIDITLKLQEDWEQFEYHFDQVHGDFLSRLQHDYPKLSPNEQKLCTLLRLNLNTKEIANILSISLRGVEVARYRLRKKLELEKGQNLSKFILEY